MRPDRLIRRLFPAVAVVVSAAGCASSGAVPRPLPTPGGTAPAAAPAPTPETPVPAGEAEHPRPVRPGAPPHGHALSGTALALRGAPYRTGGTTPEGFDCSGLVQYVFARHGVSMPRETREQFRVGRSVKRNDLAPGDLVFFSTTAPGASHVGILIGGDEFVHAPSSRGVVRVERLSSEYWNRRFIGARRPR